MPLAGLVAVRDGRRLGAPRAGDFRAVVAAVLRVVWAGPSGTSPPLVERGAALAVTVAAVSRVAYCTMSQFLT